MRKLTYSQIRLMQRHDIQNHKIIIDQYRKISTPFTYLFYRLGFTANSVTTLTIFLPVIGAFVMLNGTYFSVLIGILLFVLFRVLDDSDGELARILNSKSAEGIVLDRIGHAVYTCFLSIGLSFGLRKLLDLEYEFVPIVALSVLLFSVEDSINLNEVKISKTKKFQDSGILMKIFSIVDFQGLLYKDRFFILILLLFVSIAKIINLVMPYILMVAISKIFYISSLILKLNRNKRWGNNAAKS